MQDNTRLIDLLQLVSLLWSRWLFIAVATAGMIALALAYVLVTTPVYKAQSVIFVDPRETRVTEGEDVLPGIGRDSAAIASQLAVLSSRNLLNAVIGELSIATDPEFAASSGNADATFDNFRKRLSVERQGLTYIIEVGFTSRDPAKAARIVNAIVKQYLKSQVDEKSSANTEVTSLLNDRIVELRGSVAAADAAVEEFKAANSIFDVGQGRTLLQVQIEEASTQVSRAQELARQALGRYDMAKAAGASAQALAAQGSMLSSPAADRLRDDYNALSVQLASVEGVYGPRHPQYIALSLQLRELRGLMTAEAGQIIRQLEGELRLADENLAKANGGLASLQARAAFSGQKEVELRELERKAAASREVLEQYLKRSTETGQLNTLQRAEARVITAATAPLAAAWPRSKLLVGVAGLLGAVAGVGLALLLGERRREAAFAEPVRIDLDGTTTVAPSARSRNEAPAPAFKPLGTLSPEFEIERDGRGAPLPHSLNTARTMAARAPDGFFSRQVSAIARDVLGGVPDNGSLRLIAVTSSHADVEQSLLSYNLASEIGRNGTDVLILDLRPLPETRATQAGRQRASQVLMNGDVFNAAALADDATGLAVACPAEELTSGHAGKPLLQRMASRAAMAFDVVVVNCPPAHAESCADILEIADSLILVSTPAWRATAGLSELAARLPRHAQAGHLVVDLQPEAESGPGHGVTALSTHRLAALQRLRENRDRTSPYRS